MAGGCTGEWWVMTTAKQLISVSKLRLNSLHCVVVLYAVLSYNDGLNTPINGRFLNIITTRLAQLLLLIECQVIVDDAEITII